MLSHFRTWAESRHYGDAAAVSALRGRRDAYRTMLVMISNSVAEQLRAAPRHVDAAPRGSGGGPAFFAP